MLQPKAGYIDARPLTANSTKTLATHGRTIHSGQSRHSRDFQRRLLCPQSRPSRCGRQTPLRANNSLTHCNKKAGAGLRVLTRDEAFLLAANFTKLPMVPRQILKDIPRPPNLASRDD